MDRRGQEKRVLIGAIMWVIAQRKPEEMYGHRTKDNIQSDGSGLPGFSSHM